MTTLNLNTSDTAGKSTKTKSQIIVDIIMMLFLLLFVYAAVSKLIDIPLTTKQMWRQPFPKVFLPYLVWGIPILELVIAGLLIVPKFKYIGLWASFMLMCIFTIYIGLVRFGIWGDHIPCSCGGIIQKFTWLQHFYFNLFFVLIGAVGLYLLKRQRLN